MRPWALRQHITIAMEDSADRVIRNVKETELFIAYLEGPTITVRINAFADLLLFRAELEKN